MPQAIVESDDLRNFAANLKQYNNTVADATNALQSQFDRLSDAWRDQNQAAFAGEFEQIVRAIGQFQQVSEQLIPILLSQAEAIEEYHRRGHG